jgi:hypothetical protein
VKEANYKRRYQAPNRTFLGASDDSVELKKNKTLAIDYIVAPPRMAYYMEYSTKIYNIYLKSQKNSIFVLFYILSKKLPFYKEVFLFLLSFINR